MSVEAGRGWKGLTRDRERDRERAFSKHHRRSHHSFVIVDLATARFIRTHHGALLIGPHGVGKSHVAVAIAVGAIRAGYHAFVRSAFDLAQDFTEADAAAESRCTWLLQDG